MNAEVLSKTRFDVHRAVTDSIVKAIESGAGEFQMPWHGNGAAIAKPQNAHTKMEYHGINVMALWAEAYGRGYQSGYWATYRQWCEVGAQVKKDEKGTVIVFYKKLERDDESEGDEPVSRLFARASWVFNADQVLGWEAPIPYVPVDPMEPIESVETFVKATKAEVKYGGGRACYHVRDDYIEMPDRDRFIGSKTSTPEEAHSAVILHELVHWCGARHRLDRGFDNVITREWRANEELVAEIGAAFLCADLAVSNEPRPDHAAYVDSWLTLLKNDVKAIFRASHQASHAAIYLHELASANDW